MSFSIVYSSRTGNTRMLAETIQSVLPGEQCLYFGTPDDKALEADRIYVGFWTSMGTCDETIAAFLKKIGSQQVFLFGTAGFGGAPEYFDAVLKKVRENLGQQAEVIGTYMCQGKMPQQVRQRYEQMLDKPEMQERAQRSIENFDRAVTHPDAADLETLAQMIHAKGL